MSTLELASVPAINDIVQDLLAIMRRHTRQAGEGWNGATTIEQAGIDSFELVELIFNLEDKYGINVHFNPNASDHALATVEDVARIMQASIRRERTAR
jgi:acyl carrier protein